MVVENSRHKIMEKKAEQMDQIERKERLMKTERRKKLNKSKDTD